MLIGIQECATKSHIVDRFRQRRAASASASRSSPAKSMDGGLVTDAEVMRYQGNVVERVRSLFREIDRVVGARYFRADVTVH